MQTTMYIAWAVAIVAFGIAEGLTAQLVSIWFVIGGVAGLIAAICNAPISIQIIAFVVVSIIALVVTRPIVKKKLTPKIENTNADRCVGKEAIVIEDINNIESTGQVKADGKIWTARSLDCQIIKSGEIVLVERIEGVKLIVLPTVRENATNVIN